MGLYVFNGNGRYGYYIGGSFGINDGVGVLDKVVVFYILIIWYIYDYEYKKVKIFLFFLNKFLGKYCDC